MSGLLLIDALKARMQWLQARQTLVSANVANANTPNFRPMDLAPFQFKPDVDGPVMTDPAHQSASLQAGGGTISAMGTQRHPQFETKPSGNSVVLEDEVAKNADIQIEYQLVTSLYSKSLSLLRMAVGGR